MDEVWMRFVENLVDRVSGPMKFRVFMQPTMACIFAVRAGLKDARAGRVPYLWSLLSDPGRRADIVKDGWKDVGRVFVLAALMDVVYQIMVLHFVYVGELVIVAVLLAIVPYLLLRGAVTHLARRREILR